MSDVKKIKTAVILGAGKLATQLSKELVRQGIDIKQVYCRSYTADLQPIYGLEVSYISSISELYTVADLYVIAVSDNAITEVAKQVCDRGVKSLLVHTSGSTDMSVLKDYSDRIGVLYPMQTFSKENEVNFKDIPFFIEANNKADESLLIELACRMSDRVQSISSEQRKHIHVAAVFACNFTNYMFTMSSDVLAEIGVSFDTMLPLIEETIRKLKTIPPVEAQTGPAIRQDSKTIDKHLDILKTDKNKHSLYKQITESIYEYYKLRPDKD